MTGGGGGIGAACARRLAALGAHVTVADLDEGAATAVAHAIGGEAWAVDLTATRELDELTLEVDILVNNAGIQRSARSRSSSRRLPPDPRLMVEAPFLLIRAAPAAHVRARLGAGGQRLVGARTCRLAVQVGVRHRQARARGPVQGDGARGRRRTASPATASIPATCAPRWSRSRSPTRRGSTASPRTRWSTVLLAESTIKRLVEPAEVGVARRLARRPGCGMVTARRTRWTAAGSPDDARLPQHRRARPWGRPPRRASGSRLTLPTRPQSSRCTASRPRTVRGSSSAARLPGVRVDRAGPARPRPVERAPAAVRDGDARRRRRDGPGPPRRPPGHRRRALDGRVRDRGLPRPAPGTRGRRRARRRRASRRTCRRA